MAVLEAAWRSVFSQFGSSTSTVPVVRAEHLAFFGLLKSRSLSQTPVMTLLAEHLTSPLREKGDEELADSDLTYFLYNIRERSLKRDIEVPPMHGHWAHAYIEVGHYMLAGVKRIKTKPLVHLHKESHYMLR